jgi:hypothetical protein
MAPRCPCGRYTISSLPTDHICSDGTGCIVYAIHADQTASSFERALHASYQPRPEPRERERRKRWLEEHARRFAGRRP